MDPGSRNRIADLHDRALECAPEERRAFLENACNGDHALLEEVESLLRSSPMRRASSKHPRQPTLRERPIEVRWSAVNSAHTRSWRRSARAAWARSIARATRKLGRDVAIKILPPHFTATPTSCPLRARGAAPGGAQSSAHRRDLRPRGDRWRDGAGPRAGRGRRRWPIASRAGRCRSPRRSRSRARLPKRSRRRTRKASSIAI